MKIYTFGCLVAPIIASTIPVDGLIKIVTKTWTVEGRTLYGYCEYNRPLTREEIRDYHLVGMGAREEE